MHPGFLCFIFCQKEGEVSIRRISNELYISHSAASQMVSSLQEKGYVKSKVSKEDARHKVVTFTAKVREVKGKGSARMGRVTGRYGRDRF